MKFFFWTAVLLIITLPACNKKLEKNEKETIEIKKFLSSLRKILLLLPNKCENGFAVTAVLTLSVKSILIHSGPKTLKNAFLIKVILRKSRIQFVCNKGYWEVTMSMYGYL